MNASTNPATSHMKSPHALRLDDLAARLRSAGVADVLPERQLVTIAALVAATHELEYRLAQSYAPEPGARSLHAFVADVREALEADDLGRAINRLGAFERDRARLDSGREWRIQRERELAEARALPAPAAWAEVAAERGVHAPAAVEVDAFAAELSTERDLSTLLRSMFDAQLVEGRGVVDDEMRRLRHALVGHGLPAVTKGSVFAADVDTLMPSRAPFAARSLASNKNPPRWLVDLARELGVTFPRKPMPPYMQAAHRIGDLEADAATEREVHERHEGELKAWGRGTADAHGQVVGRVDAALDALATVEPGGWRAWWLYQLRHHVAGERDQVRVSLDLVQQAISMDSVWSALVEPVSMVTSKRDSTTKAGRPRTRE